ncbi:hypothetical protein, conserved [Eimeria acervulina]|uniref:proton-translocating NAD(P)(+) transhydrogenase n=1 Tax=Eimeria acervulina TaxID=5801 RepID=U6GJG3_EIMAC|nr:hypothetical protein, conserved [Eimeria acervulina]CDI80300.1 hypothetical protein, conserved [Eimeria acervulina]
MSLSPASSVAPSLRSTRSSVAAFLDSEIPNPSPQQQQQQQQQQGVRGRSSRFSSLSESYRFTDASSCASTLLSASNVLIVPGFGAASSRCGAELRETLLLLVQRGVYAQVAVSPAAGLFPGHISLYLQDIPDALIITGDEAAERLLQQVDVCLVVGASDVVSPLVLHAEKPQKGLIIEAWRAEKVICLLRLTGPLSNPKYNNPTFKSPNACIFRGDAKKSLQAIIGCMRQQQQTSPNGGPNRWPPSLGVYAHRNAEEEELSSPSRWPPHTLHVGFLRDRLQLGSGSGIVAIDPRGVRRLRQLGILPIVERASEKETLSSKGDKRDYEEDTENKQEKQQQEEPFTDEEYRLAGARLADLNEVLNLNVLVHPTVPPLEYFLEPSSSSSSSSSSSKGGGAAVRPGGVLICCISPGECEGLLDVLGRGGWSLLSLLVSSSSLHLRGIAALAELEMLRGQQALLRCMYSLPRVMKGLTTAAGRINPAVVLVLGAGPGGLHAAAAACKAGAEVYVLDPRVSVKTTVESIGAVFLSFLCSSASWEALSILNGTSNNKLQETLRMHVCRSDIIISAPDTEAFIGGPPPPLIPQAWSSQMKQGAVLIDLRARHPKALPGWYGSIQLSPRAQGGPHGGPSEGGLKGGPQGGPPEGGLKGGPQGGPPEEGLKGGPPEGGPEGGPTEGGLKGGPQGGPSGGGPLGEDKGVEITVLDGSALEQTIPKEMIRVLSSSVCSLLQQMKTTANPFISLPQETGDTVLQQLLLLDRGAPNLHRSCSVFRGRKTFSQLQFASSRFNSFDALPAANPAAAAAAAAAAANGSSSSSNEKGTQKE